MSGLESLEQLEKLVGRGHYLILMRDGSATCAGKEVSRELQEQALDSGKFKVTPYTCSGKKFLMMKPGLLLEHIKARMGVKS